VTGQAQEIEGSHPQAKGHAWPRTMVFQSTHSIGAHGPGSAHPPVTRCATRVRIARPALFFSAGSGSWPICVAASIPNLWPSHDDDASDARPRAISPYPQTWACAYIQLNPSPDLKWKFLGGVCSALDLIWGPSSDGFWDKLFEVDVDPDDGLLSARQYHIEVS
jgi:hypothetical protein